jgi:two-component system sensor histidine kinase PhoQ
MRSLGARMLVVASLVMVAFFGITGMVLERAWRAEVEDEQRARLQLVAYTLITAIEPAEDGGVRLVHGIPELRLFLPGSGIYAIIQRNDGRHGWVSPSTEGMDLPAPSGLKRMEERFDRLMTKDGVVLESFSIGMTWVPDMTLARTFTVTVAEDTAAVQAEIATFRRILWGWLAVLALVLLAAQWWVLNQGLTPLRRVAGDLRRIERGERDRLDGRYPSELQRLVDNLNALLSHERMRRERYRHALGDLAHSLKTPLAILRGAVEADQEAPMRQTVGQQVDRMAQIVDHQLRRAAAEGRSVFGPSIEAAPVARKVTDALRKVYRERAIEFTVEADENARFSGDADDLMEVVGNLLDNACKWARRSVRIELRREGDSRLRMVVDDDGPGIPEAIARGPERGQRADGDAPGHGIGLAMVRDIVELYGGEISFERSPAGGARVTVVM